MSRGRHGSSSRTWSGTGRPVSSSASPIRGQFAATVSGRRTRVGVLAVAGVGAVAVLLGVVVPAATAASPQRYGAPGELYPVTAAGSAQGWAYDPSVRGGATEVLFYVDGPAGQGGRLVGFARADRPGSPQRRGITGRHGFTWPVPARYLDGSGRPLFAYSLNPAHGLTLLRGAPRPLTSRGTPTPTRSPVPTSSPTTPVPTTPAPTTPVPTTPVPTTPVPTTPVPTTPVPTTPAPPTPVPTTPVPTTPAPTGLPAGALLVGPGQAYATPCAAIAAARPGDTIGIDAAGNGSYDGDVCSWSTDDLTIVGINGRAHIDAAGRSSQGKATWVISGKNTRIENVELSGATSGDRNGAGIRQEGAGLTVVGSSFHDNEDGILAGANADSDIVVDSSEFAANGAGDGASHNFYIGAVRSFTLRYSWSHDAKVGHLAKSRALTNHILYNLLSSASGTASYELDLPNGGRSDVVGNTIVQGPATQNPNIVAYGEEGGLHPDSQLSLVGNTIVNQLGRGAAVLVGADVSAPVLYQNDVSVGSATQVTQAGATLQTDCVTDASALVDAAAGDYRLRASSPCAGTASPVDPALTPTQEYVQPTSHRARTDVSDPGAYVRG